MKIIEAEEFIEYLERLSILEAKNSDADSLTKDYFGKKYICGCDKEHIFSEKTGILWRRKLSGAFVLIDKNCDFANYVEGTGIFKLGLKTVYSSNVKKLYGLSKKINK